MKINKVIKNDLIQFYYNFERSQIEVDAIFATAFISGVPHIKETN